MPNESRRGLKYLRGETSQVETAKALGLNYKTYNHFENRRRRPRDLETLVKMADYFGVSVEELIWHLGDDDDDEQAATLDDHSSQATKTA